MPRCYPAGFCEKLLECYESRGEVSTADLRHKWPVDLSKSDKDLWSEMPIGDIWLDGEVHKVWFYLMTNKHLKIPDSWFQSVMSFHNELSALESWL